MHICMLEAQYYDHCEQFLRSHLQFLWKPNTMFMKWSNLQNAHLLGSDHYLNVTLQNPSCEHSLISDHYLSSTKSTWAH